MARVIVSSGALCRQLQPHHEKGAKRVDLRIRPLSNISLCTIVSYTTCTEIPCETYWQGGTALVELDKLLPALKSIEDQPITLDLHEGELGHRLFAYDIIRQDGFPVEHKPVVFEL